MANNPNPNPNPNCSSRVARGYPMSPNTQQQPFWLNHKFVFCFLFSTVFFMCATVGLIIYKEIDESRITSRLNVTSASLSYYYNNNNNNNLNLNHSSADLPLQTFYEIALNFTMHNQHRNPSIEYLHMQAQVLYSHSFFTDKEYIPSFSLAKHESTHFQIKYLVQPKPHLNQELLETREATGMLVFVVNVFWRSHTNDDDWADFLAKCDDVMFVFGNDNTTTAFMLGVPKQCNIVRTPDRLGYPKLYSTN